MYSSVVDRFYMLYMQDLIKYWSLDAVHIPFTHFSYCYPHRQTFNLGCPLCLQTSRSRISTLLFQPMNWFHSCSFSSFMCEFIWSSNQWSRIANSLLIRFARDSTSLSPVFSKHCCHKSWYILSPELILVVLSQLWLISANVVSSPITPEFAKHQR